MKELAEDNFEFDENRRKFSKWVEITGKKRNCSSRSVFKRLLLQTHKNQGLFRKELNLFGENFKVAVECMSAC